MAAARIQYPRDALVAARPSLTPEVATWLGELTDVVFFASLESEEGVRTRARVVFHPRGAEGLRLVKETEDFGHVNWETPAWQVLPFASAPHVTRFNVECLVKAAPMAQLPRTALIVAPGTDGLVIEGMARRMERSYDAAIEEEQVIVCTSDRPGQVVLSVYGYPFFWYESGSTLDIEQATELHKLLSAGDSMISIAMRRICASIVNQGAPPLSHRDRYAFVVDTLTEIVETMVQLGHGGLLAILPPETSISPNVGKYRFPPAAQQLLGSSVLHVANNEAKRRELAFQSMVDDERPEKTILKVELQRSRTELLELAQVIGCLTCVDNALLLGPELQVLCAGYQIETLQPPPKVLQAGSLDGKTTVGEFPLSIYGSRHAAAASFASSCPGAVVLLLSEDGALRCLHRPLGEHAEVLLWNIRAPIDL